MTSSQIIPLLGKAQHMTGDDHVRQELEHNRQGPLTTSLAAYYKAPVQPRVVMPNANHLANQYPVFSPSGGNNHLLKFQASSGTPYGQQDPIQEAVVKLAELGVKTSLTKSKVKSQRKPKEVSIFQVSKR